VPCRAAEGPVIGSKFVATILPRRDASGEITGWVVEMLKGKLKGLRYLCETRVEADAKARELTKQLRQEQGVFLKTVKFLLPGL
jgi:hypothetical protein